MQATMYSTSTSYVLQKERELLSLQGVQEKFGINCSTDLSVNKMRKLERRKHKLNRKLEHDVEREKLA